MAKYKCKVCGYIHEGNKAPDVCPVCAAPASDFEEMKDEAAADKKKGLDRDSNVYTVVYASVMVVLSQSCWPLLRNRLELSSRKTRKTTRDSRSALHQRDGSGK